jgi:hypothetical protein
LLTSSEAVPFKNKRGKKHVDNSFGDKVVKRREIGKILKKIRMAKTQTIKGSLIQKDPSTLSQKFRNFPSYKLRDAGDLYLSDGILYHRILWIIPTSTSYMMYISDFLKIYSGLLQLVSPI